MRHRGAAAAAVVSLGGGGTYVPTQGATGGVEPLDTGDEAATLPLPSAECSIARGAGVAKTDSPAAAEATASLICSVLVMSYAPPTAK